MGGHLGQDAEKDQIISIPYPVGKMGRKKVPLKAGGNSRRKPCQKYQGKPRLPQHPTTRANQILGKEKKESRTDPPPSHLTGPKGPGIASKTTVEKKKRRKPP